MISVLFLVTGLVLGWLSRPRAGEVLQGEQAADLCAALLLTLYGSLLLISPYWQHAETLLLLQGLSWYAALPLLALVGLARFAQSVSSLPSWDRVVWGRILLALCVVFELTRRANELDWILLTSLAVGGLSAVASAWAKRTPGLVASAVIWATLSYWPLSSWPAIQVELLAMAIATAVTFQRLALHWSDRLHTPQP
ncbi:hypothetical protein [Thalassolituus sp.]|uniref:hypothetical protein n=1 Tax=Thalassolituus sp. TaxID=2030822 RepID=UPI0035182AAA